MKKYLSEYPKLASEWHQNRNHGLTPENVTYKSGKKVWWQCPLSDDHEWQAVIASRSNGVGCPFCAGKKVGKSNNLRAFNPELASEWHPEKNRDLRPEDFTLRSGKKVWWQCPKVKDHEWEASIHNRGGGSGCPFCVGQKVDKSNNLQVLNPILASEWHPSKNKDLIPEDFTQNSNKTVWWQCPRSDDHEWQAVIANRNGRGDSCPFCSGSGTSKPEIRILFELRYLLGSDEVQWRSRIDNVEIDIFIPQYNIGIEYDGSRWHKEKLQSDIQKNEFFQKKGIQIIRVREHPLQAISKNDIVVSAKSLKKDDLNALILKIKAGLKLPLNIEFDSYISNSNFLNESEFKRFISFLPSPPPEDSILSTHPEIAKQWHYEKNSPLKPENFASGMGKKVWWQCPRVEDHEWEATIIKRCRRGTGCPFCAGQKVGKSNNLRALNPKLASEWHPTKNKGLKPEDFTLHSGKKVWWQCSEGEDHEWEAIIANRSSGKGCPFCAGRKKSVEE